MHEPCGAIFVGEGARAWPREGAGAAGGYQDSLADLAAGPRGEGVVSVLERAGTGVDPDRVDRRGANAALVRVAWIRRGGKRPISSGPAPQDGGRRTLDRPPGLPGESGSAPVDRMQCGGRGDRCRLAGARRDRCDQDGSSLRLGATSTRGRRHCVAVTRAWMRRCGGASSSTAPHRSCGGGRFLRGAGSHARCNARRTRGMESVSGGWPPFPGDFPAHAHGGSRCRLPAP